jgi:hypothetical protein
MDRSTTDSKRAMAVTSRVFCLAFPKEDADEERAEVLRVVKGLVHRLQRRLRGL